MEDVKANYDIVIAFDRDQHGPKMSIKNPVSQAIEAIADLDIGLEEVAKRIAAKDCFEGITVLKEVAPSHDTKVNTLDWYQAHSRGAKNFKEFHTHINKVIVWKNKSEQNTCAGKEKMVKESGED